MADVIGLLARARGLTAAAVLASASALFVGEALAARRAASWGHAVLRSVMAMALLGLGAVYGLMVAPSLRRDLVTACVALGAFALFVSPAVVAAVTGRRLAVPGLVGVLARALVLLALLLAAMVTLMCAGFLALTEDRPVLLVDVTGETSTRMVRWAPPDQPSREEPLVTHHVVFREPGGEAVAEAWIYGDEVAVKGRVLRLSPFLNVAGVPNLFELAFAHNGYSTAERHNTFPHVAVPLPPMGPLAVHPLWRGVQARLLAAWEREAGDNPTWSIRAATIESTYFPLVETDGAPTKRTFRLVVTPGGLSAS
jgi:hypothetical protein